MAWERRGGRRFYYRKARVGGRVVSEYIGAGVLASTLAELDGLEREIRKRKRRAERGEREAEADSDREFSAFYGRIETLYHAAMIAAGYHRPARGPWRKRRMAEAAVETEARAEAGTGLAPAGATDDGSPAPPAALDDLVKRARKGDVRAAVAIRKALADDPQRLIALGHGDVSRTVEVTAVAVFTVSSDEETPEDCLRTVAIQAKLEQLRRELAGPDPSPVERLLAERAALCWLRLNELEIRLSTRGLGADAIDRLTRRLNAAHGRYLSSLKALATVRRLALPPVQVNLATGNQTVVAQQNNATQQVVGDVRGR